MTEQKKIRGTAMVPVTPETIQIVQSLAPIAQATRMYGVANEEQAMLIMLKGWELGLGLTTSFEFIDIINGRPSLKPKGAIALIQASGELAKMDINDLEDEDGNPVACRVYMERTNGFAYEVTFSIEDAKRAGLIKPDGNWEKYPANMLRWRAVGYCADIVFPDSIGGLYRPEELGVEVDRSGAPVRLETAEEDNMVIDVQATPKKTKTDKEEAQSEDEPESEEPESKEPDDTDESQIASLGDLIDAGHTAEGVLAANEGKIPATPEDCQRVYEILEETQ